MHHQATLQLSRLGEGGGEEEEEEEGEEIKWMNKSDVESIF